MATITHPSQLAPDIEALLAALRWRIRAYVWVQGLALVAVVLGVSFWLSLVLDFWQEPPVGVRIAILGSAAAVMLAVGFRYILSRALVPLSDRSMAVLLERRFHDFGDSLLTSVELSTSDLKRLGFNPEMLNRATVQALHQTHNVDLQKIFKGGPLLRSLAAGMLLVASIAAFAFAAPAEFDTWKERNLFMSNDLWPRKTRLEIEGFVDGRVKVAKGSALQVMALADTRKLVPDRVEIRYSTGGGRTRENMVKDGQANPARDSFQRFAFDFQSLLTPVSFDIVGGDDRLRNLQIDVVDSPTITGMTLYCEFPKYMVREALDLYTPREVPVTEFMQLPVGTRVTVRAKCNKPLLRAQVVYALHKDETATEIIQPLGTGATAAEFHFTLANLNEDKTLLFTLHDTDGISNREPVRLSLGARPDEPPQLKLRLRGIGTAITPAARLPLVGEINDDYGLASAWFEYSLDEGESTRRLLGKQPEGRTLLAFEDKADQNEAFDVRDELKVQPKQKLTLIVKASDKFDLEGEPHVGSAQRFPLDIVTPDQLRLLLEGRQLNLRRRFEQIIEEVTQTRETLGNIKLEEPAAQETKAAAANAPAIPSDSNASLSALFAQRALQNCRKNSHETLGVAVSFDDIREELVNNRLDTEELKARLKDRIADPLRVIAETRVPELERRLEVLLAKITDKNAGSPALTGSIQQVDLILVEMQQILTQMLELETFNEAVALLRSIIEDQQKINEQTKKKRKAILDN